MKRYWSSIIGLDHERSIWVVPEDLGKEKTISVKNKRYRVRIPQIINTNIVLRLRGLGKTWNHKTGDLFLHVWLNRGEDVRRNLWLSESLATNGGDKRLVLDEKTITMVIPPRSYHGLTIRLKGLGRKSNFSWRAPFLQRRRGNMLVRLCVYPDRITPRYGSFDALSTEDMVLEGRVYRRIDEVIHKIGNSSFPASPLQADRVADLFNGQGWRSIFPALVRHLKLTHLNIALTQSHTISMPGSCQKTVTFRNNGPVSCKYLITIHDQFLDNPFSVAAILAHELCHVIYAERIDGIANASGYIIQLGESSLDEEHTVDLLVFMFKIGEFQLRVARDTRLTLGYFDQEIFERMQGIVSKKLNPSEAAVKGGG